MKRCAPKLQTEDYRPGAVGWSAVGSGLAVWFARTGAGGARSASSLSSAPFP
jgi:hypothetical protein